MDNVGKEIGIAITELGKLWKKSEFNPKIDFDSLNIWENLILSWVKDKDLPLVVRKQSGVRGSEIEHTTGRKIIISDNSFPQWIYYNLLHKKNFSVNEICKMLSEDDIPFTFAIKSKEKNLIKYKKCIGNYSINKLGWKLCHIDGVGLKNNKPIEQIDIEVLEDHFLKLANPKNMFLIPLKIGGIGEIQEFIDEQKFG